MDVNNTKYIKYTIVTVITMVISVFYIINFYFSNRNSVEDLCLDNGYCKEGLLVNTEYGMVKIDKNSCEKYAWIWDDKNAFCKLK